MMHIASTNKAPASQGRYARQGIARMVEAVTWRARSYASSFTATKAATPRCWEVQLERLQRHVAP